MDKEEKYLFEIAETFKRLSSKVKLLALIEKAHAEYQKCDLENGFQTLLQAYEINKENPTILRGFGCFWQAKGEFEKAIDYYKRALEFSNKKEIEYTLIGTAYYLQDKLDEAVEYFNLAIDENDDYDEAYEGRNQAMLENHLKILDLQESLKKYF